MIRRLRLLSIAALLIAAPVGDRRAIPEPIGILIEAGASAHLIPGRKLEYDHPAHVGDLIYEGYKLTTGGQRVTYLDFGDDKIHTISPVYARYPIARLNTAIDQVKDDFDIRFDRPRPVEKHVRTTAQEPYPDPVIPPDSYRSLSAGDRERLARSLAGPGPPVRAALARMTMAWIEERENQPDRSLRDYQILSGIWKDAGWIQKRIPNVTRNLNVKGQRLLVAGAPARNWAILIGVREHQYLPELPLADRDAELVRAFLEEPKGGGVPRSNVIPLLNQNARTALIRNTLSDVLTRRAGPRDSICIFVSTYGLTVKDFPVARGYLLGYDGVTSDKQAAAYALSEMGALIRASAPAVKRIIVLADVSGSGEAAAPIAAIFGRQLASPSGNVQTLLAAGEGEKQNAPAGARPFSTALVEGLRATTARDLSEIDVKRLFASVSASVRKQTHGKTEVSLLGGANASTLETAWAPPSPVEPILLAMADVLRLRLPRFQTVQAGGAAAGKTATALEEEGQQVIRTYLRGHEVQQDPEDFHRAAQLFGEAERSNPSSYLEARRLFCEGRWLTSRKKYGEALLLLNQALAVDPPGAYSYNALGIAHLEQAQYEEAAWAFRDAIRLAPDWVYPRHNLALTYSEAGSYRAAEWQYREALRIAPEYASLHYNLGSLLHRLNRIGEAEQEYNTALAYNPKQSEAWVGLGAIRAGEHHWREAEQDYVKALQNNQTSHAARHDLGEVYIEERRFQDAIDVLSENIRLRPEFLPSRLRLAQAYNGAGRFKDASREYEEILKQRKESPAVQLAILENLGDESASAGPNPKTAEHYLAALKLADNDADRSRIKHKLRRLKVKNGS